MEKFYDAADAAIRTVGRESLLAFSGLKLASFDEVRVFRKVMEIYRTQARKAKKKYRDIGIYGYLFAMGLCGRPNKGAKDTQAARRAITPEWVEKMLEAPDPVTQYAFNAEVERKAQRLIESLSVTSSQDMAVDTATRYWVKQFAQYAIEVTDAAVMQAFEDAGEPGAFWVTKRDPRVCSECRERDGQWFSLKNFPPKPHWGCRCERKPGSKPGFQQAKA